MIRRCIATLSLISFIAAFPAQPDASGQGQRYAVIRGYSLGGKHNVRWETSPMKYLDPNTGKPMNFGMVGTKSASPGCIDVLGKTQSEGAEYERPNGKFKYTCKNGEEEVTACVASERANKALIKVGQTLEVNGFWHKCESHPNGSVVYTQETSCSEGDKEYRVGEEILVGFLRFQCQEHGYKVVGCFYFDQNNKKVPLNSGEKREEGKVTHNCEEKGDTLQYYAKSSGCSRRGKEYKEGEEFSQNHLKYKCANGMVDVVGCYKKENEDMTVGQDIVDSHMVHRCYRLGGKIEYNEYACGYNGTPSCKPEPIPQTPDDVPALGRGLISPGFGSFAAVQHGPGGDVPLPQTLNLQLDKSQAQRPF